MEEKKLTGFAIIAAMFLMMFIGLCALCSCTTKSKVITEYVYQHDTLYTYRVDTVHNAKYIVRWDTIRQVENHVIYLRPTGDTIKEFHYYHDRFQSSVVDSTYRYQAERDSLRAALNKAEGKTKVVVKTRNVFPWYNWLVILAIIAILAYLVKRLKSKV